MSLGIVSLAQDSISGRKSNISSNPQERITPKEAATKPIKNPFRYSFGIKTK